MFLLTAQGQSLWEGQEFTITNVIRLKLTCRLLAAALRLFSPLIWDLELKLGLNWDHFRTLVPIGTKSQIWDLTASYTFISQQMIWIG